MRPAVLCRIPPLHLDPRSGGWSGSSATTRPKLDHPTDHCRVQVANIQPLRGQPSIEVHDEAHVLLGRAARITQPRQLVDAQQMPPPTARLRLRLWFRATTLLGRRRDGRRSVGNGLRRGPEPCIVTRMANDAFRAVAHPIRRGIVERLARGPATVGVVTRGFGVSKPTISKHLKVLEHAGVVVRTVAGRTHQLELNVAPLSEAAEWFDQQRVVWTRMFDAVDDVLNSPKEQP
jgi:DNA-binding transcriptional ArsR family regulator